MPKQNKSALQKLYRNKELDGFSLVRTEIRHATGGELDPKTRQDVLRKAARLIRELSVLNAKLQHQLYKYRPGSETPPSYVGGMSKRVPSTGNRYIVDNQQVLVRRTHIPPQTAAVSPQTSDRQPDYIHLSPAQAMNSCNYQEQETHQVEGYGVSTDPCSEELEQAMARLKLGLHLPDSHLQDSSWALASRDGHRSIHFNNHVHNYQSASALVVPLLRFQIIFSGVICQGNTFLTPTMFCFTPPLSTFFCYAHDILDCITRQRPYGDSGAMYPCASRTFSGIVSEVQLRSSATGVKLLSYFWHTTW
ncbi:hypothetical protein DEU56DRAFT_901958 [Suillus clintonianus]|uniref:uncharacterized protein n=1 Tax=Suillus clintonianus TaxID=1904413 RepID=UPI001B881AA4|nr:uncharacterized protein DEU56DRAFT_901958 [Suillus clintonianus]KAG2134825.1 hypothetical protein DEU56DRAFT_901958 [Suillus clintonianus]